MAETNCINQVVNSFKMNSMSNKESWIHGTLGVVGLVAAIALLILSTPISLAASVSIFAFSATLLAGSLLQSRGIVYTAWIAALGFYLATAFLMPSLYARRVVVQGAVVA